jgi:alpha-glucosidase
MLTVMLSRLNGYSRETSPSRKDGPMDLLQQPHHDGSPTYVDDEAPALGRAVTVRCRTWSGDPVTEVWLRTTKDAEPTFHPCRVVATDDHATWWEGELPVPNPLTHYRFLVRREDAYDWLTGAGVFDHDVPDAFDFRLSTHRPAPDWGRDGVVYQVFPDRFARSAAADERPTPDWAVPAGWDDEVVFEGSDPRTPLQLFGGDLDGITEHLDHVAEVGADIVYTTPVFPGESNHRYNASTFDAVDPLLGGDAAYARLAEAVHARGWRILGDLTTNHTGDTHEWFEAARAGGPERDWYSFHPDGSYETWMGHHTLPKLDHGSAALRAMFTTGPDSVVGLWLHPPYSLDGWRIDVANMTGRLGEVDLNHEVARTVRRTATSLRQDALVIGEHNHDASDDLPGDGWHGTMNYAGFSWPVWEWLRSPDSPARSFGTPVPVPRRSGGPVAASIRMWHGRFGWRNVCSSWNILGSHDSARIRTMTGSPEAHRVAAGLQFTLPGVPMIFAGDEIGLEGVLGEDSRRTMPWHRRDEWDTETLAHYGALAALRREHVALRRGGLRWAHVSDDALAFVREHPDGAVLVCARRAAGPEIRLPAGLLGARSATPLLGPAAVVDGGDLVLAATDGPSLTLLAPGTEAAAPTPPRRSRPWSGS